MIRHAAAVAVVVCLSPAWLLAQSTPAAEPSEFTVGVQSATIHLSPSTGSPVIGRAPRGTVLEVTRDVGSWARVAWPDGPDGAGYVHQSMGSMTRRATRQQQLAAVAAPPAPQGSNPLVATSVLDAPAAAGDLSNSTRATYIPPPTHLVGFGGRLGGSPLGQFGATARLWSRSRLGIQMEATRSSMTSTTAPGRVTSIQFAPSAIYSLRDYVTDNVWMRPYVGGGAAFHRATLKLGTPDEIDLEADTRTGFRAFGGAELTFPAAPRFAVSAELGHLWMDTPYPGFDSGGLSVSVSGHWYVK